MESVTRRSVLVHAVVSAVGAVALSTQASAQGQPKIPQKAVAYRTTPNGNQKCSNCSLFIKPNACQKVAGDVSPDGYCILYRKA
jgi:hypothetical protein